MQKLEKTDISIPLRMVCIMIRASFHRMAILQIGCGRDKVGKRVEMVEETQYHRFCFAEVSPKDKNEI